MISRTRLHAWIFAVAACTIFAGDSLPADEDQLSGLKRDQSIRKIVTRREDAEFRDVVAACMKGSFDDAVPVLVTLSKGGDLDATYILAKLHLVGAGVEKSAEKAKDLLAENGKAGHALSMYQLGVLKEANKPAESIQLYKIAAGNGDEFSSLKLGDALEQGLLGMSANPKLAYKYYRKAENLGSAIGAFHTARCLDQGIGATPDPIGSTRMYRKAAMAGVAEANTVMARRYFGGDGVDADAVAAIGWLVRGVQAGSTEAMVLLGQRYEMGEVIGKNLNQAGQLYSQAATRKDPAGLYSLAKLYYEGKGTKQDIVRSFVLLSDAQSLPKAESLLEKIRSEMSPEQLKMADEKLKAEAAKAKRNAK